MIEIENRQRIDQPVERVFAFAADPENNPQWWPAVQKTKLVSDRPLRPGSRFRETGQGPLGKVESLFKVAAYEPDQHARFVVIDGPLAADVSETFTTVNGGTELTVRVSVKPQGVWRLLGPVLGRMLDKNWRGNLLRLKTLLEEGAS